MKRRKPEIAEGTYKRYKIAVERAILHLNPQLAILDKASILHIRDKMAEEFAPATVNLTLKILRMALQEAVNDGLLASNPAKAVKNLRGGTKVKRPFTMEELVRLLKVCDPEWRALTILGLITGQRLNDLTVLKWHQVQRIQLKAPERQVGILILTTAKTGKHLELPLPPLALTALTALAALPDPLSHDLPIFPDIVRVKAPSRSNYFRALLHQAKLTLTHPREATSARGPGRTVQPLSFHSLRHTATTLLKACGASLSVAQAVVGHDSQTMSEHYTHLDPEQLRPAVDAMTDRLEIALGE